MALRSALAPSGAGSFGGDQEPGILAEGVSKQYPGRRVLIFPPVLSIFERDLSLFGGRRRSAEDETRQRPSAGDDYVLDDEDDDDDEDERDRELDDGLPPPRARPDEMFWALKDVSLRVPPGAALGVLGGQGAGKTTLLRILSGRALPTEGRVFVRGRVSPLPADLHKALAVAGKRGDDLVLACRLLGVDPHLVKQHEDEIMELAQPLKTPDGDPVRGARARLATATSAVLPADVVLLEETRGLDEAFIERVFDRLHERLRAGASLVLASRRREFFQQLCDEVLVLHEGLIVDRGDATQTAAGYDPDANGGQSAKGKRAAARRQTVTPAVAPFNECAALLSAEVQNAAGKRSKRLNADEELVVEIRLETAVPEAEVQCGVRFTPRRGGTGLRLDLPEPVRLGDPRTYVLAARIPPGTLRAGGYTARAEAVVAGGLATAAGAIARDIGRLRIVGDELPGEEPGEPPAMHGDGRAALRVEAEWSID